MSPAEMLFWLVVGHAVADFALQSDWMAKAKNRHYRTEPPPGQKYQAVWPMVLSSHAAIHGGAVALVTGLWQLGLAEFVAHWLIDFGKCEKRYGIYTDQGLHLACKVVWLVIASTVLP